MPAAKQTTRYTEMLEALRAELRQMIDKTYTQAELQLMYRQSDELFGELREL
jgi:hypothetical protein